MHDMACIKIESDYWEVDTGWRSQENSNCVRLAEDSVQIVAAGWTTQETRIFMTYLDEGFISREGHTILCRRCNGVS